MTRAEKEQYQKISKKCRLSLAVSLGLVVSLGIIKMILSNRAATWGHDLYALKQETESVKKQNLNLKAELIKLSGGLENLSLKAQKLGFTDKPKIKYFAKVDRVAQILP